MIKVGNILIEPNDVSSIHCDKSSALSRDRGFCHIQVIYKNGVVKNFTSAEIGMDYESFIDTFLKNQEKEETDKIFRLMAAIKSANQ